MMKVDVHPLSLLMSSAYLVEIRRDRRHTVILVDSGSPGESEPILSAMQDLGVAVLDLIFLTHAHYDHMGGAARIQERTGAPVAIHAADADDLAHARTRLGTVRRLGHIVRPLLPVVERLRPVEPVVADLTVTDGHVFCDMGVDVEVIHTPGHTLGSATLRIGQTAFVGDLISNKGRPHAQMTYAQDWEKLEESLGHIQEVDVDRVYAGHGIQPLDRATLQALVFPVGTAQT